MKEIAMKSIRVTSLIAVAVACLGAPIAWTQGARAPSGGEPAPLSSAAWCESQPAGGAGALGNPTGKFVGGGEGYGSWIDPADATVIVSTRTALLKALAAATSGDIIYVDDSAEIQFTAADWRTVVNAGVTLASGRGRNGSLGALLYTTDETTSRQPPLLRAQTSARITGLRLRGPTAPNKLPPIETCPQGSTCETYDTRAISVDGERVEIDNNDIWNFPRSGVTLLAPGAHVHHNYIHHNSRQWWYGNDGPDPDTEPDCDQRVYVNGKYTGGFYLCGLSYGVSVTATDVGGSAEEAALIEANVFSAHRHAINGGDPNTSYLARYNLVLPQTFSHPFDMHGGGERDFCPYPEKDCNARCLWPAGDGIGDYCASGHGFIAGQRIEIYENTFLNTVFPSVKIRATPQQWAEMLCNHHRQPLDSALVQSGVPSGEDSDPHTPLDYRRTEAANFYSAFEPYGSSWKGEPYTEIISNASGAYNGYYLGVDSSTGAVRMYAPPSVLSRTRWRLTWDNDVLRIQTLAQGPYYGQYLTINTSTGAARLWQLPTHTGTKWTKDLYQDGTGRYARLVSKSNGTFNGQSFTLDLQDGDLYGYWNENYSGTLWRFKNAVSAIVELAGTSRRWSDGTYARSCHEYRYPPAGSMYKGATSDGVYTVDPTGGSPFDVYCNQTTHGGGWTLIDNDPNYPARITSRTPGAITDPTVAGGRVLPAFAWSPDPQVMVSYNAAPSGPYIIMRATGPYALQYPTGTTATWYHDNQWAYYFQNGNPSVGTRSWTYNGNGRIGTLWIGNGAAPNMACGYMATYAGLGGWYREYHNSWCSTWAR